MDQLPTTPKVLFSDTNLRLSQQDKTFVLEYLTGGEVQFSEQYDCKLCAIRAVLLATVQLQGHCNCSPSVLTLESADVVAQAAGGLN